MISWIEGFKAVGFWNSVSLGAYGVCVWDIQRGVCSFKLKVGKLLLNAVENSLAVDPFRCCSQWFSLPHLRLLYWGTMRWSNPPLIDKSLNCIARWYSRRTVTSNFGWSDLTSMNSCTFTELNNKTSDQEKEVKDLWSYVWNHLCKEQRCTNFRHRRGYEEMINSSRNLKTQRSLE